MIESTKPGAWQDPSVWSGGQVPTASACVYIRHVVTLSGYAKVSRCEVDGTVQGAELAFDPGTTTTLESIGNVVVRGYADSLQEKIGRLRMQPSSRSVVHTIRFLDIDESAFVGGGMSVLETDVGLWVDGPGAEIIAEGTSVGEAWNRVGTHPDWLETDELIATPVQPNAYQYAPFTLGDPVDSIEWRGRRFFAEVCNLTRNVRIEGTPEGYGHIMLNHVTRRSSLRDVAIRYMGIADSGPTGTGRYGLHIHHGAAPGCKFERVIVRDCKGRAFVVHGSAGPTQLRECLAVDTVFGYWWDFDTIQTYPANASHGVIYDKCGAVRYSTARGAFDLGQGVGNVCNECFAACGTHSLGGGYHWPAEANFIPNVWRFEGCRTHNTVGRGIWTWQNDENAHVIRGFTAFNCNNAGIQDGAYGNTYVYDSCTLFNCARDGFSVTGAFSQHAASRVPQGTSPLSLRKEIRDNLVDGRDWAPGIQVAASAGKDDRPVIYLRNQVWADQPILIHEGELDGTLRQARKCWWVHTTVDDETRDLEPSDVTVSLMHPDSEHLFERRDGTCYQVHPDGSSTVLPDLTVSSQL